MSQSTVIETPVAYAMPAPAALRSVHQTRVDGEQTLDAMVAAAPSAENPFKTRANRLRRAKFLLARQAATPGNNRHVAPQTTHAEPASAASPDRTQTVYRFGADANRQGFLKPRTR